jgi:sulfide:quinone oxidoreductase
MSPTPVRVLIAGGGVAAAEAVLALRALAGDRVSVKLLAPADELVIKPEAVRSPFSGTPVPRVPLDRLPVRRHASALAAVDTDAHEVLTTDGGRIGYDQLIIATGARSVDAVPGATLFRGPLSAGKVEGVLRAARSRALFVAPPGCGWPLPVYELALLASHELPQLEKIAIVSPEPRPLDIFGRMASDALARLLDRAGIEFLPNRTAVEALDNVLVTEDGRMLSADAVVAMASLRGPAIDGLPQDPHGFLAVDEHCRVTGVDDVFAAGDVTVGPVKQGGLARSCSPATRRSTYAVTSMTTRRWHGRCVT